MHRAHIRAHIREGLLILMVIVAFSVAAGKTTPTSGAEGVDPTTLVGNWEGKWAERSNASNNGGYYLTIEKVEGKDVYVQTEQHHSRGVVKSKAKGAVEGNHLIYTRGLRAPGETMTVDLEIDGNKMRGTATSPRDSWNITLGKTK